ncbi:MAG: hypothetical protein Q8J69_07735 [Sphingobacteriaceae bacterium]|nr:hypothetical protein [Sphingobacteriaceae bacterium]
MILRKYFLNPNQWADLQPLISVTIPNFEGQPTTSYNNELVALVADSLPRECLRYEEQDGHQVCVELSDKLNIDIVWQNEPLPEFKPFLTWPANPKHSLGATLDNEYFAARALAVND